MGKFALIRREEPKKPSGIEDFTQQVFDVLVKQLGHRAADAKQMITKALKRNNAITTPEELFEEVYRGERD
jgi:Holliday junction DNA helicase RuvA